MPPALIRKRRAEAYAAMDARVEAERIHVRVNSYRVSVVVGGGLTPPAAAAAAVLVVVAAPKPTLLLTRELKRSGFM